MVHLEANTTHCGESEEMMKIGWCSDSHLGNRQYGLERRRKDFEHSFESAVNDMMVRGIKVVVHTGDLLNSNRPGPDAIHCLVRIHQALIAHGAHMIVASGNHDYSIPSWPSVLPPNEFGIKCRDYEVVRFGDVSFYCLPTMPVETFLKQEFQPADVLLWHGMVKEFIQFDAPNALDISQLPLDKYRLILLGDVHVCNIKAPLMGEVYTMQGPGVGYIGSTELCSSSEPDVKYWGEVDIVAGRGINITRHVIDTRPVVRVSIDNELTDSNLESIITMAKASAARNNRTPILFIEYDSSIPRVVERFRLLLNPDEYILQFRPIMKLGLPGAPMPPSENLSVEDILKNMIAARPDLMQVGLGLVNQEMEPGAVIDEFIGERLRKAAVQPEPANL